MARTTIAALLLLTTGCFHASVDSGMKPGAEKIEKEWASSWVFGLVAPEPIEAKTQCPSGVAKVETEHSFLNALVAFFTLQIYTPMHLTVTCGTGATAEVPGTPSPAADGVATAR